MKLYSDFGPRRTRQIFADVIALAFIGAWIWFGATIYGLAHRAVDIRQADGGCRAGFRETMTDVGDALGGIPLDRHPASGRPSPAASDAGERAGGCRPEPAGSSSSSWRSTLGIGVALLPILMILVLWLVPRVAASLAGRPREGAGAGGRRPRSARVAGACHPEGLDHRPTLDADAMGAWRRGDEAVLRRLAALELEASGIRLRSNPGGDDGNRPSAHSTRRLRRRAEPRGGGARPNGIGSYGIRTKAPPPRPSAARRGFGGDDGNRTRAISLGS